MKLLRFIDLVLQTILIAFAFGLLVTRGLDPDFALLLTQLCLGILQLGGSLISVMFEGPFHKEKLKHFLVSIFYLMSLFIVFQTDNETIVLAYFFLPSWVLALYYYFITIKRVQLKASGGKFLPHINF